VNRRGGQTVLRGERLTGRREDGDGRLENLLRRRHAVVDHAQEGADHVNVADDFDGRDVGGVLVHTTIVHRRPQGSSTLTHFLIELFGLSAATAPRLSLSYHIGQRDQANNRQKESLRKGIDFTGCFTIIDA
jgi:hypothetical protein